MSSSRIRSKTQYAVNAGSFGKSVVYLKEKLQHLFLKQKSIFTITWILEQALIGLSQSRPRWPILSVHLHYRRRHCTAPKAEKVNDCLGTLHIVLHNSHQSFAHCSVLLYLTEILRA